MIEEEIDVGLLDRDENEFNLREGDRVRHTDAQGTHRGQVTRVVENGMVYVKWNSGVTEKIHETELSVETEQAEFYEMAMDPRFPNMMDFELTAPSMEDERTFSIEGLNEVANQMRHFTLARLVAYGDGTGKLAKRLRVRVSVRYDDGTELVEELHEGELPFYTGIDDGSDRMLEVDGLRRIPLDNPWKTG